MVRCGRSGGRRQSGRRYHHHLEGTHSAPQTTSCLLLAEISARGCCDGWWADWMGGCCWGVVRAWLAEGGCKQCRLWPWWVRYVMWIVMLSFVICSRRGFGRSLVRDRDRGSCSCTCHPPSPVGAHDHDRGRGHAHVLGHDPGPDFSCRQSGGRSHGHGRSGHSLDVYLCRWSSRCSCIRPCPSEKKGS